MTLFSLMSLLMNDAAPPCGPFGSILPTGCYKGIISYCVTLLQCDSDVEVGRLVDLTKPGFAIVMLNTSSSFMLSITTVLIYSGPARSAAVFATVGYAGLT